jgi:hypothetical protein
MKAKVIYYFAGESERTQLGEIEIDPPPGTVLAIGGKVRFATGGKTKLGTVEAIQPAADGSECPEVTVRLRKPVLQASADGAQ